MKELKEKLKQSSSTLRQETTKRVMEYMLAAFGLVAGLAWNEAIKSLIEQVFPQDGNNLWAKFVYALVVTLIVVVVSVYLVNLFKKDDNEQQ